MKCLQIGISPRSAQLTLVVASAGNTGSAGSLWPRAQRTGARPGVQADYRCPVERSHGRESFRSQRSYGPVTTVVTRPFTVPVNVFG
jgi:hypothetical protein